MNSPDIPEQVRQIVDETPVLDIHTHLYLPTFNLTLWGIDELLTYHYLVAETLRFANVEPEAFFSLPKGRQADLVWDTLFVRNTPISEATTGVITVLSAFGLDPNARDLKEARNYFEGQSPDSHFARVFELAGIDSLVMTNDPFDEREAPLWSDAERDPRFHAALRLDPLLNGWPGVQAVLEHAGFEASLDMGAGSVNEIRRFLDHWIAVMKPKYVAVSLPPSFAFPEDSLRIKVLEKAVLPTCAEHDLPFAMMLGVRKRVNPRLGDAGDSVGYADVGAVERLCASFPLNRFLATTLARENAQGLCVAARKFANLMPFGCWWFMNNPSLVEEVTLMRLETLGASFVPQHSDARVLEQLVYKWRHSRRDIATALTRRYELLTEAGRAVSREEIERDVRLLLRDNAANWIGQGKG